MSKTPQGQAGQQKTNSQGNSEIWYRVGHVEVVIFQETGYETYDFDGLDFKFSVSQILGRVPEGNMSVSICGLSLDTANKIVTLCNVREALRKRKLLKLYAGYADPENKDYKGELIAAMDIINATISTPPPDIWLQIKAVYAGWQNDCKFVIDVMDPGKKKRVQRPDGKQDILPTELLYVYADDVMNQSCIALNKFQDKRGGDVRYDYDVTPLEKTFGKSVSNHVAAPGRTRHFTFRGTLAELPTRISETYKILCVWEIRDDGKMYLVGYPDPKHAPALSEEQKKNSLQQGSMIKFLDVDHGLIGIPKLKDSIKLECRCFLDGKIQAGDYVSVRSQLMPAIYESGEPVKPSNQALAYNWGGWDSKGEEERGNWGTVKAYQIMKIKYSGHLRGSEWFCDIEARRPSMQRTESPEGPIYSIRLTEDWSKKLEGWKVDEVTGEMSPPPYKYYQEMKPVEQPRQGLMGVWV